MIIDTILDRRDHGGLWHTSLDKRGKLVLRPYTARQFYIEVTKYGEVGHDIAEALDSGKDSDVKNALCSYIRGGGYNEDICEYINSVAWL